MKLLLMILGRIKKNEKKVSKLIVLKNPYLVDEVLLAIKALQSLIKLWPEISIQV
jgi:hypothetical protein